MGGPPTPVRRATSATGAASSKPHVTADASGSVSHAGEARIVRRPRPSEARAVRRRTIATRSRNQALVEEAAFGDPLLVGCGNRDVRRGQQEHLVGHPLDAAAGGEDQAGGEVDEPLGVRVVHLREVHDHRSAVAVLLPHCARLVVGARVQGRDPRQLGHHADGGGGGRAPTLVDVGHRRGARSRRSVRTGLASRSGVLGVVPVAVELVVTGVLEQAEVFTDPAHRTAHGCCLRLVFISVRPGRDAAWLVVDITGPRASNRGPRCRRARVSRRP